MGRWGLNPLEGDKGLDEYINFENFIYRKYYESYKRGYFRFKRFRRTFEQLTRRDIQRIINLNANSFINYLATDEDISHIAGFILFGEFELFKKVTFTDKDIDRIVVNTIYDFDWLPEYEASKNDMKPYDLLRKNKHLLTGTYKERVKKIKESFEKNFYETDLLVPKSIIEVL